MVSAATDAPRPNRMNANADLLKSLKIDRSAPPPPSRKSLWIGLGVAAAVLLVVLAGWWLFARGKAIEVQVAPVVAIGGGNGGAASVLDATGYVVARRMATVSAKITGRVREIRIEEGQHVDEGQVIATLEQLAKESLPSGYGYEWTGTALQEKEATGQQALILGLALLFVFLVLAAQYESWSVPFAVLFGLPIGVFGAFLGAWLAIAETVKAA